MPHGCHSPVGIGRGEGNLANWVGIHQVATIGDGQALDLIMPLNASVAGPSVCFG
jgi:hypothetical protein